MARCRLLDVYKESLKSVEDKAIKVLSILEHTPVLAFGQNFEFVEDAPSDELLKDFVEINRNIIDHVNEDIERIASSLTTTLKTENGLLHFTRSESKGSMSLKFNFHYDVNSASEAAEKMNNTFEQNLETIEQILASYNNEINEAIEVQDE